MYLILPMLGIHSQDLRIDYSGVQQRRNISYSLVKEALSKHNISL